MVVLVQANEEEGYSKCLIMSLIGRYYKILVQIVHQ